MSIEICVVLAHLTNRFLVLDGNTAPPANIVSYYGRVNNERPSRVTDLIDIPVPWGEPDTVDLEGAESLELADLSLNQFVFYFPKTPDISSEDARCFARGRQRWVTVTEEYDRIPVLRLSEDPVIPGSGGKYHRNNLGFYSYQFYLDNEARRSVYRVLSRMSAKRPFAELAHRVASDIGSFNAVHMRRGDFKVTYGVTTLDRKPWEAIEAMDQVFDRKDPLVIVTDERDDPFFQEIKLAYPEHLFIDWHVLDEYGAEFERLPQTDSLSLAYLSQLVAAESNNFIGTMTSTFTSMIQRYRGNRGKHEPFRFLWNELPDEGASFERGRHAVSNCIALDRGVMLEEFEGPYSWNRVSQRLNPSWMREWPESFLLPETLATGALPRISIASAAPASTRASRSSKPSAFFVKFENLQVAVRSSGDVIRRLAPVFGSPPGEAPGNVIGELEIRPEGGGYKVLRQGIGVGSSADEFGLADLVAQQVVPVFAKARRRHAWLRGAAFARAGRAIVVAGDLGSDGNFLAEAFQQSGWDLLQQGVAAIRIEDLVVIPFGVSTRPEGAAGSPGRTATPLASIAVATRRLQSRDAIMPLSPSVAVAELVGVSLDFPLDRDRSVERLCRIVERLSVAQLSFSRERVAAELLSSWGSRVMSEAA